MQKTTARYAKKQSKDDVAISCSDVDVLSDKMNRIVISDGDLLKDPPPKEDCIFVFFQCHTMRPTEMAMGGLKQCCPFRSSHCKGVIARDTQSNL